MGSGGFVGGHYGLTVRSWSWVLAILFHLSLLSLACSFVKSSLIGI
jgi:hypothetical protein